MHSFKVMSWLDTLFLVTGTNVQEKIETLGMYTNDKNFIVVSELRGLKRKMDITHNVEKYYLFITLEARITGMLSLYIFENYWSDVFVGIFCLKK